MSVVNGQLVGNGYSWRYIGGSLELSVTVIMVSYVQRYLFNANCGTNHNANGNPNSSNPTSRYRCE